MRFIIYGILAIFASVLIMDVNIGRPVDKNKLDIVNKTIIYLYKKGFDSDANALSTMTSNNGIRESKLLVTLIQATGTEDNSYYAYTPILSRSRIFIGDNFWQSDITGRASILIHEITHIKRHRRRSLRGFPRNDDETEAYLRQYDTHKSLGLSSRSSDGVLYWDMMIGVKTYVLPRHPEYAKKEDIKEALILLNGSG
ncbi:MAG: hypothetical protein ACYC27_13495 [Armatimonadota bacterium]